MRVRVAKFGGIIGTALLIAGGVTGISVSRHAGTTRDLLLTAGLEGVNLGDGTALIMGPGGWPVPGDVYTAAIDTNYLQPLGFTGDTVQVTYPWSNLFEDWDTRVASEAASLVSAVNAQWETGDYGADNPLVIVGYSESAVAASQAMSQLSADGIPSDALHFVLIGDTASPDGGFLSTFVPSLPEWLRTPAEQFLNMMGLQDLVGVTTPTDLYPTDVFTIPGDMWSQWPADLSQPSALSDALAGFFTHLEYPGLSAEHISTATLAGSDGMIDYYTLPETGLSPLAALWNTAVNMGDVPTWLADWVAQL